MMFILLFMFPRHQVTLTAYVVTPARLTVTDNGEVVCGEWWVLTTLADGTTGYTTVDSPENVLLYNITPQ